MAAASEDEVQASSAAALHLLPNKEEGACRKVFNFDISFESCLVCGLEHDSPEFGPYCAVCHDFLYPNAAVVQERDTESSSFASCVERTLTELARYENVECFVRQVAPAMESEDSGCESESENNSAGKDCVDPGVDSSDPAGFPVKSCKLPYLSLYERVRAPHLIAKRLANELNVVDDELFDILPPEILLMIFSFLDDISLCMVGQVCQRWRRLAGEPDQWKSHLDKRWPLLRPEKPVKCWRKLYIQMLQGVTCRRCFEQGCVQRSPDNDLVNSWRNKRLKSELKSMLMDPPDGIRACPMDGSLSHWQASIKGPPACPYEDGLFFLHLEIPKSYPMRPPIARFITRIFHPNVSYHGDVGLDALRHNWSLALTIPKVLVSIQSLLTDPYCHISMEPEIAQFCEEDREDFDKTAREWTVKYARLHMSC